jgi:hypothetical protein
MARFYSNGAAVALPGSCNKMAVRGISMLEVRMSKSHQITPDPKESGPRIPRPKTDIEREQEREQALRTPDKLTRKRKQGGPMAVGVDFDHSSSDK